MPKYIVQILDLTDLSSPEVLLPVVEASDVDNAIRAAEEHYQTMYPSGSFYVSWAYTKEYLQNLLDLIDDPAKPDIIASGYTPHAQG